MVTGPKSENRSIRKSRSIAPPVPQNRLGRTATRAASAFDVGRLELHRLAAAAGANLVRIVEDELSLHSVGLVIHLGAEQEQNRFGVDQDLHALILDDFVGRANLMGIFV